MENGKTENEKTENERKVIYVRVRTMLLYMVIDLAIVSLAYICTRIFIYFPEKQIPVFYNQHQLLVWLVLAIITLSSLTAFGCNRTIWRYTSTADVLKIILAMFFTVVFLMLMKSALLLTNMDEVIETTFLMLYSVLSTLFLMAPRFAYKLFRAARHMLTRANIALSRDKRILVYGAGYTGRAIIEQCINSDTDGMLPVAIIDDDTTKHGSSISGVRIYGGRESLADVVRSQRVDQIIIAIQQSPKQVLKEIYQECVKHGKPVKIVPRIESAGTVINGNPHIEIRDVKMDELLGREVFETNHTLIDQSIKNKVVLVTGGAGSIGSELCRQALQYKCKHLVILDSHENSVFMLNQELSAIYPKDKYSLEIANVREKSRQKAIYDKYKPSVVIHAAAYKHVPMMELSPVEAIKNNVFGTKNVIEQCVKSRVKKFILVSTDKAVNPANIMGASKRIAEMLIQYKGMDCNTQLAAVRFGNVLGSNGSVVGIFLDQIRNGGPVTLTHNEIKRYFMTIPEAVTLVLQAGALASRGEVFVLDMGEPVFIRDLAIDLIKMHGLEPERDIKIKVTGLRPGEKLFEELRFDNESCDETLHRGIFVCKLQDIEKQDFEKQLDRLQKCIDVEDDEAISKLIFEIVPSEYRAVPDQTDKAV